jgi:hypothetical protein
VIVEDGGRWISREPPLARPSERKAQSAVRASIIMVAEE